MIDLITKALSRARDWMIGLSIGLRIVWRGLRAGKRWDQIDTVLMASQVVLRGQAAGKLAWPRDFTDMDMKELPTAVVEAAERLVKGTRLTPDNSYATVEEATAWLDRNTK